MSFGEKLASSAAFANLFRDGMALVEETAAYLDGPGRQESKKLERSAALAYATESMRLTTRLMQLASWLLLHRAVKEGEMTLSQANKEKTKVKLSVGEPGDPSTVKLLPQRLRDLIDRSRKLNDQVRRLDANIYAPPLAPDQTSAAIRWSASSACSRPRSSAEFRRNENPPLTRGFFFPMERDYFLLMPRPANFFSKRDSRPPRSSNCWFPPVQAGCDFGSMSRCSTSPFLPQVERVVNSLPSVILTVMV